LGDDEISLLFVHHPPGSSSRLLELKEVLLKIGRVQ
jgi:hypothetical protein